MDTESLAHVAQIASVVLACMSGACVIGTVIMILRWRREARGDSRPLHGQ
jgi:hypothetical protein